MSKQDGKPLSRTQSLARSLHARQRALEQRALGLPGLARVTEVVSQPTLGAGILVAAIFTLTCAILAMWTRGHELVAAGRIADRTQLVTATELSSVDLDRTQTERERARLAAPRVLAANDAIFESLAAALSDLPDALASAPQYELLDPDVRDSFDLNPERFARLKDQLANPAQRAEWTSASESLVRELRQRPLLEETVFQRLERDWTGSTLVTLSALQPRGEVYRSELLNRQDRVRVQRAVAGIVRDIGLTSHARDAALARVLSLSGPTYRMDDNASLASQNTAAGAVREVRRVIPRGSVIVTRGEAMSPQQIALLDENRLRTEQQTPQSVAWVQRAGVLGACVGVTAAISGYAALFSPRIRRRVGRIVGVAVLLLGALAAACAGGVFAPQFLIAAATLPTLLVTVLLCVGYDRRAALAFSLLHAVLVCLCLRQDVTTMAIIVTGIGCVVSTLREVRDRRTLVRSSMITGLGLSLAAIIFGVLVRPLEVAPSQVLRELVSDAISLLVGSLAVGGLTLFLLPYIERAFAVTTGMTLSELRDPKQPLLRELQLRAPGTYTHSLNVASIAEAAAEAIGADSLLTYVGALYHDVGKMNKPEYFVENQTAGINKHDRLSPAMSLLIVVGHVKDGMELAREFRLPATIQHFIEAHHGTTLVEYFFHRAKQAALAAAARDGSGLSGGEPDEALLPDEFEYRYPGPRPRTREVAIVMIADACESATRSLVDPTPSRIDQLVRDIADRRLRDGQMDQCEITLRELAGIVESVSRTLQSMYHGRIAYPASRLTHTQSGAVAATPASGAGV